MNRALITLLLLLPLAAGPARAQSLITSLSNHRVLIGSNFVGADLVLFGTVEPDGKALPPKGDIDIIVKVRGPRMSFATWRKDRIFGMWINAESRTFVEVPAYLAMLSNRPIEDMASLDVLRRQQLGIAHLLLPQQIGPDAAEVTPGDAFRAAFVARRSARKLYREDPKGVTFLSPTAFRATLKLPANVPIGSYELEALLLRDGKIIARQQSAFEVYKIGFEQFVADAAKNYPLVYGLIAGLIAVLTGWLASVIFRKD